MIVLSRKQWTIAPYDKNLAAQIAEQYSLPPFTALLLVARGIVADADVERFLSLSTLTDPFLLTHMDKAAARINRAIEAYERIAIYGDYDADGVTATALLYSYLETRGADAFYYIPDRAEDGYGLKKEALEELKARGAKLVITVDNGISAVEEANYAKEIGLELIITDHHLPPSRLPDTEMIVNPCCEANPAVFKGVAGVGVAFKLLLAMEPEQEQDLLEEYADLVALGTIADVVPLLDENRMLVQTGLRQIAREPRMGIRALQEVANMADKPVTATGLAFTLLPRINAAGRMGSAERAVQLLLCETQEDAAYYAQEIDEANTARQQLEGDILAQAREQILADPALQAARVLVVAGEDWNCGVLGIVAARLMEIYGKPCFVLTCENGCAKGSGRSIQGFSLYEALASFAEQLHYFGGHTLAAGLTMPKENIAAFRVAMNDYAAAHCPDMPFMPLNLDCKLNPSTLQPDILDAIQVLEPFGKSNPEPLFGLFNMYIEDIKPVGNGNHLRITFSRKENTVTAMRFGVSLEAFPYQKGDCVDLAVKLQKNEFKGVTSLSVQIRDLRPSGVDEAALLQSIRLYECWKRQEALAPEESLSLLATRQEIAQVYRTLKQHKGWRYPADILHYRCGLPALSFAKMMIALEVLQEFHIITMHIDGDILCCGLCETTEKADLDTSVLLQQLKAQ